MHSRVNMQQAIVCESDRKTLFELVLAAAMLCAYILLGIVLNDAWILFTPLWLDEYDTLLVSNR